MLTGCDRALISSIPARLRRTLRGSITGDGKTMRFDVPYQTILVIDERRVLEHDTFFNYPRMNIQALAQAEGALAYELLPRCLR